MRRHIEASWGDGRRELIETVEDLDALLDRVGTDARRTDRPQDVQLIDRGGAGTLGVVVGHDRSVLHHVPADGNPPYKVSVGDQDEARYFTFYVSGTHHSESLWRNTLGADKARSAARLFLLEGSLDRRVCWEEV